ncbi:MAG: hypothetical protein ACLR0U_03020 [Enterocloster clostridioformis]
MNRRNISPQAVRICGLTLLCLVIMFGVAAANRARGGEKLVSEYTVQDEALPRHVKFESMPADMPQMTAAWFYKYKGLGQLRRLLQWEDGEFTRVFAGGPGAGLRERWKIFELGMM